MQPVLMSVATDPKPLRDAEVIRPELNLVFLVGFAHRRPFGYGVQMCSEDSLWGLRVIWDQGFEDSEGVVNSRGDSR
jgi:hypothetical protein